VLSVPEIARVIDRALAGSLPEELARSHVRNRVDATRFSRMNPSGRPDSRVRSTTASAKRRT
jgi:hypothetical protein